MKTSLRLWAFVFLILAATSGSCRDGGDEISNITEVQSTRICASLLSRCTYPTFLITNAVVTLRSDSLLLTAQSDVSGKFWFIDIPEGVYRLTATSFLYDTASVLLDSVHAGKLLTVELWLSSRRSSFAQGNIIVGFWDTTSLSPVFNFVDSLGLQLETAGNFVHSTAPIRLDSARTIAAVLQQKQYVSHGSVVLRERGDSSTVTVYYFQNMTRADYLDWVSTRRALSLFESADPNKYLLVKVPIGQECSWVQKLKGSQILRYIVLNYLGYLA